MHLYTEGNSPSLRPQLGVGWNRALPTPFSFGNCALGDGTNDHFSVPGLSGVAIPDKYTVELWRGSVVSQFYGYLRLVNLDESLGIGLGQDLFSSSNGSTGSSTNGNGTIISAVNTSGHLTMLVDRTAQTIKIYHSGRLLIGTVSFTFHPTLFKTTKLGLAMPHSSVSLTTESRYFNWKMDEFRFYSRHISLDEMAGNYNSGAGNNPSKTEGLLFWYSFDKAESDTDLHPGGNPTGWTSGSWGIRDKTRNGYHAMQVNMTNNSTLGGVIQPY